MTFEDIGKNFSAHSIETLASYISKLMHSVGYRGYCLENQHLNALYRARKHNHIDGVLKNNLVYLFKNDIEFWNPPEKYITEYGRCNDKNESLFYCSNSLETCIAEVKPKKGDYITVSRFLALNRCAFSINPIGINTLKDLGVSPTIKKIPTSKGDVLKLDKNLEKLFLVDVNDSEKDKYKLSIAVSSILLKDIINQYNEIRLMHGIIYPSLVSHIYKSVNFAFKPISIIENFIVSSIQTFRVLNKYNGKITIKLVKHALTHGQKFNSLFWQEVPEKYGEEYTYDCFPN